eukprot:Em0001g105a
MADTKYQLLVETPDLPKNKKRRRVAALTVGLIVTIVLAVVVIVALSASLGVMNQRSQTTSSTSQVCQSQECIKLSAAIISALDETVDPCQDFYNFSCGNWVQNNVIPDSVSSYNQYTLLSSLNSQNVRAAILQLQGTAGAQAIQKLKDLYASCTSATGSTIQFPLMQILLQIGGWALLNSSNGTEWSLNGEQFLQEKLLGSPAFFSMSVGLDDNGGAKLSLKVVKSGLTLPSPESYLEQDALSNLTKQIVCQLQKLNPDGMLSDYEDAASGIAAVEYALAAISRSDQSGASSITLKQLGSLWKDYSWVENTAALFRSAGVNDITENEIVSVNGIQYFSDLSTAIGTFSNSTLQNYAKWQLLNSKLKLFAAVTEGLSSSSNDFFCLAIVNELMPIALGRVFAEYILPADTKTTAAQMMVNIMRAFRTRIGSRTWLDQQTIAQAQNKIDLMIAMIAYPNLTFNDTLLNTFYSELIVSADDFASNLYYYLGFEVKTNLAQFRQPANLWTFVPKQVDPLEVNAFYSPSLNQIYILQGIMRPPFFHPSWPQYFQYGFLGGTLGHEITHGFDNNGRLYNGTGQMQNMWTQSSIDNFESRQQCYIDQYSSLSLFGIHDDGLLTLGENIADNGGLISSYTAYQTARNNGGFIPQLPGLNYTDEQLFFIAFGQCYCGYVTPGSIQNQVLSDVHSPGPLRVLGPAMNSNEFAAAFKCPVGSPMNPATKCSLW